MKTIRIKPFKYSRPIPPFKLRSEQEMEEILHKWRVVAHKRRLEDEISHPITPFALPQYQTPERRKDFLKFLLSKLSQLLV